MSACKTLVDKSRTDYDAHGSFSVVWQEACGAPVHSHGRCRKHHDSHCSVLRCMADFKRKEADRMERELAELTNTAVCTGTGLEVCK